MIVLPPLRSLRSLRVAVKANLAGRSQARADADREGGRRRAGSVPTLAAVTVTVDLDDNTLDALRAEAQRRGVPVDVVVTESVREHLAAATPRRQLTFVGIGASGQTDGAERHREIIDETYADKTAQDV